MAKKEAKKLHGSNTISFNEVGRVFARADGPLKVIGDCSFTINAGEFVSVIGPSGCGKTTLLNMVAGFDFPDQGSVTQGNEPITAPSPSRGVVFQQYAVFPWLTVKQNIAYGLNLRANKTGRNKRTEIVDRYIPLMGLEGFEDSYPKELSGGMRQRVAIARAYTTDPQILLMDEPFAALDAQTRESMQELLHRIQVADSRTAMFITHSVEEAIFLSNRVVVMTKRPSRVNRIVDIDIPADRTAEVRTSTRFVELRQELEGMLR